MGNTNQPAFYVEKGGVAKTSSAAHVGVVGRTLGAMPAASAMDSLSSVVVNANSIRGARGYLSRSRVGQITGRTRIIAVGTVISVP